MLSMVFTLIHFFFWVVIDPKRMKALEKRIKKLEKILEGIDEDTAFVVANKEKEERVVRVSFE